MEQAKQEVVGSREPERPFYSSLFYKTMSLSFKSDVVHIPGLWVALLMPQTHVKKTENLPAYPRIQKHPALLKRLASVAPVAACPPLLLLSDATESGRWSIGTRGGTMTSLFSVSVNLSIHDPQTDSFTMEPDKKGPETMPRVDD